MKALIVIILIASCSPAQRIQYTGYEVSEPGFGLACKRVNVQATGQARYRQRNVTGCTDSTLTITKGLITITYKIKN